MVTSLPPPFSPATARYEYMCGQQRGERGRETQGNKGIRKTRPADIETGCSYGYAASLVEVIGSAACYRARLCRLLPKGRKKGRKNFALGSAASLVEVIGLPLATEGTQELFKRPYPDCIPVDAGELLRAEELEPTARTASHPRSSRTAAAGKREDDAPRASSPRCSWTYPPRRGPSSPPGRA